MSEDYVYWRCEALALAHQARVISLHREDLLAAHATRVATVTTAFRQASSPRDGRFMGKIIPKGNSLLRLMHAEFGPER